MDPLGRGLSGARLRRDMRNRKRERGGGCISDFMF